MEDQYDIDKFKYSILPGKNSSHEQISLYDQAFEFWYSFWSEVYVKNGTSHAPNPDDFFRQDFIPVVSYDGQIAGLHLYSIFDLASNAILKQSYLSSSFPHSYFQQLRQRDIQIVMTMESLSVNSEFRKSKLGFSLATVLISLGQQVFSQFTNCQGIVCPARVDNKVTNLAEELGFETIDEGLVMHNTPVNLILCQSQNIKKSNNLSARYLVEKLWRDLNAPEIQRRVA